MSGMRIGLLGDNHGHWNLLAAACAFLRDVHGCFTAIQVGDCGFFQDTADRYRGIRFPIPIHAVDGNHEDHELLARLRHADHREDPWAPMGLRWMRRGVVIDLGGRTVGWCGGALHVDAEQQTWPPVKPWENLPLKADHANYPLLDDVERLMVSCQGRRPDLLITHSCPEGVGIGMRQKTDFGWSMEVHVQDRGLDSGPDDDGGEPALRHLWNRLGADRPRCWIHGHWHVWQTTTIGETIFTSLPPCDPDLGSWRPMWIDLDTLDIGAGEPLAPSSLLGLNFD
jgi:hypothetical protein